MIGTDTTRSFTIGGGGIRRRELRRIRDLLKDGRSFGGYRPRRASSVRRAARGAAFGRARPGAEAVEQLACEGIDVFLTGHLHVTFAGPTAKRYNVGGRSAIVVEAGTATRRASAASRTPSTCCGSSGTHRGRAHGLESDDGVRAGWFTPRECSTFEHGPATAGRLYCSITSSLNVPAPPSRVRRGPPVRRAQERAVARTSRQRHRAGGLTGSSPMLRDPVGVVTLPTT